MKYFVFILSGLFCSCNPYLPASTNARLNETVLIVVECKSDRQIESSALLALRTFRYNDLEKQNDGITLFIKARYRELPDHQVLQIKDKLNLVAGVWDVQVIRDGVPVKHLLQNGNGFNPLSP